MKLKTNTACHIPVGPVVGFTKVLIFKSGGGKVQDEKVTGIKPVADAVHDLPLSAAQMNFVGGLKVVAYDGAGQPLWSETHEVVPDYFIDVASASEVIGAACDQSLTDYDPLTPSDAPANFSSLKVKDGNVSLGNIEGQATVVLAQQYGKVLQEANLATDVALSSISNIVTSIKDRTDNLPAVPADGNLVGDKLELVGQKLVNVGDELNKVFSSSVGLSTQQEHLRASLANVSKMVAGISKASGDLCRAQAGGMSEAARSQLKEVVAEILTALKLDQLLTSEANGVADNSVLAQIASKTARWQTFSAETDSLEAVRDNQLRMTEVKKAIPVLKKQKASEPKVKARKSFK